MVIRTTDIAACVRDEDTEFAFVYCVHELGRSAAELADRES